MNEKVFKKSFLSIPPQEIVSQIKENGYFCFKGALTKNFIKNINNDIERNRLSINKNRLCGVETKTQYYHTHMLGISKSFYNYITHPISIQISKLYLGDSKFRIKSQRYYETNGFHKMMWHSDNKYNALNQKSRDIKGLIFISYVSDVYDGEFQYVKGSQKISMDKKLWSKNEIKETFGDESIKSFCGPSGTIIIYDTAGIHRAKPFKFPYKIRKSLFFQVDLEDNAEPLFVNPEYITKIDEQIKYYLGFGREYSLGEFPQSNIGDIGLKSFLKIFFLIGQNLI